MLPRKLPTGVPERSHRSSVGKTALREVCEETKRLLGLPDDYLVGVVPASDTGAFELDREPEVHFGHLISLIKLLNLISSSVLSNS